METVPHVVLDEMCDNHLAHLTQFIPRIFLRNLDPNLSCAKEHESVYIKLLIQFVIGLLQKFHNKKTPTKQNIYLA